MELSELKRSREILLSVLKISKTGKHLPCPFHGGGDSFSVWQARDGVWLWKCNSMQCGTGTVLDAALKVYRAASIVDALRAMEQELGIKIIRDEEYYEPQIDHERAEAFVTDAHDNLMRSEDLQEKYLRKKRGIFNLDVVKKYRLGFATPEFKFTGKNWHLCAWVLPITNAAGVLTAVKLHTEKALFAWAPTKSPKCVWAPFGTYPGTDPKHGTATLWPPPEHFAGVEKLYICPGELKALAMIGAGMAATAPTVGEGKMRPEIVRRIIAAKPAKTFITFDDDEPKMINGKLRSPGNEWKESLVNSLKEAGMLCYGFSFGKKTVAPKEEPQPIVQPDPQPAAPAPARANEWISPQATEHDIAALNAFDAPRQEWRNISGEVI